MLFGVFYVWVFFRCKVNTDSYLHPHGESEGGAEMTGIHPEHIFMFYLKWKLYVMEGVQRKWQAHGCDSEWHKRTYKLNLCCEDKWTDDRKRPRRWSEVRAARNTETGWRNVTHAVNELPACLPEWRPGRKNPHFGWLPFGRDDRRPLLPAPEWTLSSVWSSAFWCRSFISPQGRFTFQSVFSIATK